MNNFFKKPANSGGNVGNDIATEDKDIDEDELKK